MKQLLTVGLKIHIGNILVKRKFSKLKNPLIQLSLSILEIA